jgi:hypothetical protein
LGSNVLIITKQHTVYLSIYQTSEIETRRAHVLTVKYVIEQDKNIFTFASISSLNILYDFKNAFSQLNCVMGLGIDHIFPHSILELAEQ